MEKSYKVANVFGWIVTGTAIVVTCGTGSFLFTASQVDYVGITLLLGLGGLFLLSFLLPGLMGAFLLTQLQNFDFAIKEGDPKKYRVHVVCLEIVMRFVGSVMIMTGLARISFVPPVDFYKVGHPPLFEYNIWINVFLFAAGWVIISRTQRDRLVSRLMGRGYQ